MNPEKKNIYFRSFYDSNDYVNRIMPGFISAGTIEKNKTYLLYSFSNWEIGEDIEYLSISGNSDNEEWAEGTPELFYHKETINKIEHITLKDNKEYKKVGNIIESIGSIEGIFINLYDIPTVLGVTSALYQYYRNGELLYEDPSLTSVNEIKNYDITIQQTFSGEILFTLNSSSEYQQIQLFNMSGMNIQSCIINGNDEIRITGLSQGIYLYKLISKEAKNNKYGKFIISY